MKKRLTQSEEFEILKLVLDKILILGTAFMGIGFWELVSQNNFLIGGSFLFAGAVLLIIFCAILVKEYEIIK